MWNENYNPVISTPQVALNTVWTEARQTVFIDGVATDVKSYSTQHRQGATATATLELTLPAPDQIKPNAEVQIWDGHNNLTGVRFWGRIPAWKKAIRVSGNTMTVQVVGWSSLLSYNDRFDLTYQGPMSLRAIFDSLCARRGVPVYQADTVLDDTGLIEVALGGNRFIDDGIITIPASQSPLSWLNSVANPFGYYVYDTNIGTVRMSRISGSPTATPSILFRESIDLLSLDSSFDISDIYNYHDVIGPTYEDEIGRSVPIRAIPEFVTSDPNIPVNAGVNYKQTRNSMLQTQQLAEIVRRRMEIDESAPEEFLRWETVAIPNVTVGDVATIYSETLDVYRNVWITNIDVSHSDSGLLATYQGWQGGGIPLPSGVDRITIPIQGPAIHLGDENVPWYAKPAPQGKEFYWDFNIPKRATAINVVFDVHGSNSQFIGGKNEDLTVSKFEIVKLPIEDPEDPDVHSSGSLPILDENYAQRPKYATDPSTWSKGAIALKGFDEEEVSVRLYVRSGENKKATGGPWDDFELRNVYVEIYGTVEPIVVPGVSNG